jgi:hypothetical protein
MFFVAGQQARQLRGQMGLESECVFSGGAHPRRNGVPRPFFQERFVGTFRDRFGSSVTADESNTCGSKLPRIVRE